jgi:hypothetical protein
MPPKKRKADPAASSAPAKKTQKIADVEYNIPSSSPPPDPEKTKNLAVQLDEQFYASSSKCASANMRIDD